MQPHKFKLDRNFKQLKITLNGRYSMESSDDYFKQWHENVDGIKESEFELLIDCSNLEIFTQDLLDRLGDLYDMYSSFKNVVFIQSNVALVNSQIKRIAKLKGYGNKFSFIE